MQVGAEDDAQDSVDANTEDTASVDAEDYLVNVDVDEEDYEDDVWEDAEDNVWEDVEENVLAHAKYDAWMLMKILSMLAWLKKLALCLPTLPSITYIGNCIHKSILTTAKQ